MEIFLLIVLFVFVTIFYNSVVNKLQKIENKLFDLSAELSKKNFTQELTQEDDLSNDRTKEEAINTIEAITKEEPFISVIIEEKTEENIRQEAFDNELDKYIAEINNQEIIPNETEQEPIELFKEASLTPENENITADKPWYEKLEKNNDIEKFIGENLISKIGIAILVLGIGFFVKYAIDQNWINEVARVGIGILAGGIILGFAHQLRENFKAFSTVLVAGAISVFYFTIGLAFHDYHLFSQTVAFAIMLVITAFSVFISIGYNRQELAILSIIGGFATPFMVSTGSGNYVTLFTYIIILDLGMLVLAFTKKWTLVNIITYVFTILLYASWLLTKGLNNHPDFLVNALIFATIFYFIFIAMNIAYNIKYKENFKTIDFSILLSNTFIYYGIGISLLNQYHPTFKGAFTLALALSNCLLAWFIIKNSKSDKNLLYVLIGLGLTFITLAAPVQLTGNYITLFWAAEGALLLWLSQKSGMNIFRFGSVVIYGLALVSLIMDWNQQYHLTSDLPIILNKGFIAGIFMCLSVLVNVILLKKDKTLDFEWNGFNYNANWYLTFSQIGLVILVYCTGLLEISYQLNAYLEPNETAALVTGVYHLIFTSFVLYFSNKNENISLKNTGAAIGLINLFLYLIYFNSLTFKELRYNLEYEYINVTPTLNSASHIGFMFHYVSLISIIYQLYILYKNFTDNNKDKVISPKILYWGLVITITFLASSEVLLHAAKIKLNPTLPATTDTSDPLYYVNFENYDRVIKQSIKVLFPILWGVLSFIFLWFGIKNQIKHLRIAALYLLALTLVKLFVYDIREVSEGGKILAFILLGIVLLVISFMYQKIKAIIINDEPKEVSNDENL